MEEIAEESMYSQEQLDEWAVKYPATVCQSCNRMFNDHRFDCEMLKSNIPYVTVAVVIVVAGIVGLLVAMS